MLENEARPTVSRPPVVTPITSWAPPDERSEMISCVAEPGAAVSILNATPTAKEVSSDGSARSIVLTPLPERLAHRPAMRPAGKVQAVVVLTDHRPLSPPAC